MGYSDAARAVRGTMVYAPGRETKTCPYISHPLARSQDLSVPDLDRFAAVRMRCVMICHLVPEAAGARCCRARVLAGRWCVQQPSARDGRKRDPVWASESC